MKNHLKLTFLGTGTSVGIPMIACDCPVCTSIDPRNTRLRSSVLLETDAATVVIDTTPEFRLQMLRHKVTDLDAVLFTHNHADHIYGLDDVRPFCFLRDKTIPLYGHPATMEWIRGNFSYIWEAAQHGGGLPRVELNPITQPVAIGGISFIPVPVMHGTLEIYGYRFGDCAYISDVSHIPESSKKLLQGLRILIVDAVRLRHHSTHFNLTEALEAIEELSPSEAYLTHICHDIMHADIDASLPDRIHLAYDGLELEVAL